MHQDINSLWTFHHEVNRKVKLILLSLLLLRPLWLLGTIKIWRLKKWYMIALLSSMRWWWVQTIVFQKKIAGYSLKNMLMSCPSTNKHKGGVTVMHRTHKSCIPGNGKKLLRKLSVLESDNFWNLWDVHLILQGGFYVQRKLGIHISMRFLRC